MDKRTIAQTLQMMAKLMTLRGDNPFKVRAYEQAARRLPSLEEPLTKESLQKVKGIGPSLGEVILGLYQEDSHPAWESLLSQFGEETLELLSLPSLGPKKLKVLRETLQITTLGELRYAILENRLLDLPGFGETTQKKLLDAIEKKESYARRMLLPQALQTAEKILKDHPKLMITGALRRKSPVVEELSFVTMEEENFQAFLDNPAKKGNHLSGTLRGGKLPLNFYLATEETLGSILFETTGAIGHVQEVKERLKARGKENQPFQDEKHIYQAAELPYVPPELREDGAIFSWLEAHTLDELVEEKDLLGCFHNHTNYSDGSATLRQMAEAAIKKNWTYLGIADHSQSAYYARGLTPQRLAEQAKALQKLREELAPFYLFHGIECDILPTGELDMPDEVLKCLDYTVISIHSHFNLSKEAQTQRLLKALAHPYGDILGHPTGRLLLAREGYPVDLQAVLEALQAHGKAVEINANPHRLDLDWVWVRKAVQMGIPIMINPDAHDLVGLQDVAFGVIVARKGLTTKKLCMNTWSTQELQNDFRRRR